MAEQSRSPEGAGLHKYSCTLCHKRKVKCDRQEPCGYCVRHSDTCAYEAPPPPKRRKREHKTDHADLLSRLQRAEDQLRLSGLMPPGQPGQTADNPSPTRTEFASSISAPTPKTPPIPSSTGQLRKAAPAQGRLISRGTNSRYLDNNLWVTLDNELQNPHELLREDTLGNENLGDAYSDDQDKDEGAEMLLGAGSISDQALADYFPTHAQQTVLWQVYLDNIHQLTMILHRPTFAKVVEIANMKGILALPRNKIALLFSAYFFAVASLSSAQCEAKLRQSRRELLKKLRNGTKCALVKACFIRSTDMVTLQAFVQFLLCMRNGYDSQTLWVLSGAAFRIAQRMGIHREDANTSLPPFECEMRRRLWRQLLILDFTSSELAGSAPGYTVMLGLDANSRIPLNVNDEDLYEDMKELPPERYGASDMIFCRLRYEFGAFFLHLHKPKAAGGSTFDSSFSRQATNDMPITDKDKHINELENKLQTQYLRFCDPINRLHNLTTIAARAAICGMRLRAHHPRQYADAGKTMPQEEKDLLFSLSTKIMKYDVHCHAQKELQGFLWHVRVYFQWHAFIYLLNALRTRTIGDDADKSWELVEEVFYYHPEIMMASDFALYRAIRSIALRAWDAREAELRKNDMYVVVPQIIHEIRQRLGVMQKNGEGDVNNTGLPTPGSGTYEQYANPTAATESIIAEHSASNLPAMPYSVSWPQQGTSAEHDLALQEMARPGEQQQLKPEEPSPIDWDAWDSLVQNMDLPTLEFGLEAFFK